jgi:hypothetical protein
METPNTSALAAGWTHLGVDNGGIVRAFRSFNAGAESFRRESEIHEQK